MHSLTAAASETAPIFELRITRTGDAEVRVYWTDETGMVTVGAADGMAVHALLSIAQAARFIIEADAGRGPSGAATAAARLRDAWRDHVAVRPASAIAGAFPYGTINTDRWAGHLAHGAEHDEAGWEPIPAHIIAEAMLAA